MHTLLMGGNNKNCSLCLSNPSTWLDVDVVKQGFVADRTLGKPCHVLINFIHLQAKLKHYFEIDLLSWCNTSKVYTVSPVEGL